MLPNLSRLRSILTTRWPQLHWPRTRWFYGLVSFVVMASIVLGSAIATPAKDAQPDPDKGIFDILRGAGSIFQGIQLESMGPQREMQYGTQIDAQIKRQLAQNRTPVVGPDHEASQYIRELGEKMVAQLTPEERRADKDDNGEGIQYTFQVVNDPGINAFATMGGFVYINSGLIAFAETESQLTSVIGHEMAHIMERDAVKQTKDEAIRRGLLTAAGLGEDQIVNLGVTVALTLPNSRKAETRADEIGLDLLRRIDYYPAGMPDFMAKLGGQSRGGPPQILSTHPNPNNRAENLREIIAENPPGAEDIQGNDPAAYCNRIKSFFRDAITCPV
ncbi:MAG: M48 family metalloprotease [Cyanobacteria bacterium P01_G01_bin.54]